MASNLSSTVKGNSTPINVLWIEFYMLLEEWNLYSEFYIIGSIGCGLVAWTVEAFILSVGLSMPSASSSLRLKGTFSNTILFTWKLWLLWFNFYCGSVGRFHGATRYNSVITNYFIRWTHYMFVTNFPFIELIVICCFFLMVDRVYVRDNFSEWGFTFVNMLLPGLLFFEIFSSYIRENCVYISPCLFCL